MPPLMAPWRLTGPGKLDCWCLRNTGIPVVHCPLEQPLVSLNDFLVYKSLGLPKKSHWFAVRFPMGVVDLIGSA